MARTVLTFALLVTLFAVVPPQVGAAPPSPPSTQQTIFEHWMAWWDYPVSTGVATRTWVWGAWGEPSIGVTTERYDDRARVVGYYDKGRMEITRMDGIKRPGDDLWYVTSGLLATEMISGRVQVGDEAFEQRVPAQVPVAGDPDSAITPTYAALGDVLEHAQLSNGQTVLQTLTVTGQTGHDPALGDFGVTAIDTGSPTAHSVASVFWEYMHQSGPVAWFDFAENNAQWHYDTDRISPNPFYLTGYPITEPYWMRAIVGGNERVVLLQCFERRCLTYTPDNAAEWRVEMGNIGLHYHHWRYDDLGYLPAMPLTMQVSGYEHDPFTLTGIEGARPRSLRLDQLLGVHLPQHDECYFGEMVSWLSERVHGTALVLEGDHVSADEVIDGVARIWIDGELLVETMLREGLAVLDPTVEDQLYRIELLQAQREAMVAKRGLWGACEYPAEIAFLRHEGQSGPQLYVSDAVGLYPRQLTDRPGGFDKPVWSPDGSRIALSGLWIVNADGSGLHYLTEGHEPAWSPDGTQLVFWKADNTWNLDLYIINADGTNLRQITATPESEQEPEWSPDGSRIVFRRTADTGAYSNIVSIDFDGTDERYLTNDQGATNAWPVWSPDGSLIAFTRAIDFKSYVYVVRSDGSDLRLVSDPDRHAQLPLWSPDGSYIAFHSGGINVVNADGTNPRFLTIGSFSPSWSPDGQRLVYNGKPDVFIDEPAAPSSVVYVINIDGTERRAITAPSTINSNPVWSPVAP